MDSSQSIRAGKNLMKKMKVLALVCEEERMNISYQGVVASPEAGEWTASVQFVGRRADNNKIPLDLGHRALPLFSGNVRPILGSGDTRGRTVPLLVASWAA